MKDLLGGFVNEDNIQFEIEYRDKDENIRYFYGLYGGGINCLDSNKNLKIKSIYKNLEWQNFIKQEDHLRNSESIYKIFGTDGNCYYIQYNDLQWFYCTNQPEKFEDLTQ